MTTRLNPYLGFRDTARQAMDFYHSIFGGELTRSTFGEYGTSDDPAEKNKVMHSMLVAPNGITLMASDTPNGTELADGSPHSVSLSGEDEKELRAYWDGLSRGASVVVPLEQAPWGDTFGMLVDQFGISWMVNIVGEARGGG